MKISNSKYTGYIWYSDQNKPKLFNNEDPNIDIEDNINPFIIEGQLFDGTKSISIKYVDGKYCVKEYILSDMKGEVKDLIFYANRMGEKRQLKFKQYWREDDENDEDALCENMKVLQPKELVFVGFND